jgi:hypothetical protein
MTDSARRSRLPAATAARLEEIERERGLVPGLQQALVQLVETAAAPDVEPEPVLELRGGDLGHGGAETEFLTTTVFKLRCKPEAPGTRNAWARMTTTSPWT